MKNKNKLKTYFFLILLLMLLAIQLFLNDFFNFNNKTNERKTEQHNSIKIETSNDTNNTAIETLEESEPLNTLVMQTSYINCNHTHTVTSEIPETLTIDDIKIGYPDSEFKEIIGNKVIFHKQETGKCNEHYIIKEKDGNVAVFFETPVSNILLKQMTDIKYKNISYEYKEEIEKGLKIDSNTELNLTLEAIKNSSIP